MQLLRPYAGYVLLCAVLLVLTGCRASRHVPEGEYLLDKVKITVDDSSSGITSADLINYLRQQPNHKVLGFWKLQLGTYNLSGEDTTKWYNRWVRRMGQPPVIYSRELTDLSARQLRQTMINRGYLDASVSVDTVVNSRGDKIEVDYAITLGTPHRISSLAFDVADSAVSEILLSDSTLFTLKAGDLFDRDELETQRLLITRRLKDAGYYDFNKEYITYRADTAENSYEVDLTMRLAAPRQKQDTAVANRTVLPHKVYHIRNVVFVVESNRGVTMADVRTLHLDTISYKGLTFLYGPDRYLKPSVLEEKCFLTPWSTYTTREVDRTYEALSTLGILRTINIELVPVGPASGPGMLDAYILLSRNKKQSVTFDVEGTNSEGDLGFGLAATYQHRNLARGSQLLTGRLRMNY